MSGSKQSTNTSSFGAHWAVFMIRFRWLVILSSLVVVGLMASGAVNLKILTDYRAFFSPQNPELRAFEEFQAIYTKTDNLFFLIKPKDGNVFTNDTLGAIEALTEKAWQIPFATRVDSITNFQHTYAVGDNLIVEDLIEHAATLSGDNIVQRKEIAANEPLIRNLLVTADGGAAGVNVLIQLPGKEISELPAAFGAAQKIREAIMAQFSNVDVRISGLAALNHAFADDGPNAMATLMPFMVLAIFILSILFLRSLAATGALLFVVTLSMVAAMGLAGFLGIGISPVSAAAPIVILTLAVADSVHIMISFRDALASGLARRDALIEAIRTNLLAVSVTSVTTIIGFLALNFSDAPPFRALGNISAIGIGMAWILSLTLFPALASFITMKAPKRQSLRILMTAFSDVIIKNYRKAFVVAVSLSAILIGLISTLQVNDMFVEYFDSRVEFRRDVDVVKEHFGPLTIEYSVPASGPGGVADPAYLEMLDAFAVFLRSQPSVTHVYAFTDIMKRLNKNMHGDDDAYYAIPQDRNLAAQYLLLYELSLPYGLDLNDRLNIDKSASRVSIAFKPITTQETKQLLARVDVWFAANAPEVKPVGASAQIMFTRIADRNLQSMIVGTAVAVLAISLVMIIALRSIGLGLLSLVPNALPILSAFGAWALIVGEVGFSVAMVGSISLGIVVDDTVHFLMRYNRARREHGLSADDAIRYAFQSVGAAIIANTVILTVGFLILTQATFKPTVDLGLLTALSLVLALILDFLLLPALLLWMSRKDVNYSPLAPGVAHGH